jgi:DNA ligase 1
MSVFLRPMLAHQIKHSRVALDGADVIAEPKLDGVRAQVHVADHRTLAVYSRTGIRMDSQKGLEWIKPLRWPFADAILDAECFAGAGLLKGNEGAVPSDGQQLAVFDVLQIGDEATRDRPLRERRPKLEALFVDPIAHVALVPQAARWQDLWATWVLEMGGEAVCVKHLDSKWVPGWRSPYWTKVKVEETTDVVVTGLSDKATYGDGVYKTGHVSLTYGYWSQERGCAVTAGQGIKVGTRADLERYVGRVAELRHNGQMRGGTLRHARLIRFRDDKPAEECGPVRLRPPKE